MAKKRILIHTLIFSPDGVSTAYLYNDVALAFKSAGYDVVVLTTTPHFNLVEDQLKVQPLKWGIWGLYKKSLFNEIPVYHIFQKKFKSTILRLWGFLYWHTISFFIGLFIRNVDVILSPSPPLTIGILNLCLAKCKNCKVVYNVQEIYPDILGKKNGLIYSVLSWIERIVYNKSDAVTTIDQVFYDTIVDRFDNPKRLHIIPNFVDVDLYHPDAPTGILNKKLFHNTPNIKLLYAGNIGYAQDWETLFALADKTRQLNIEYFVIGEGVKKKFVERKKNEMGLEKLHILPYQPRNMMPAILSYSDIQFIFMTPQMEEQGFPSKVYTIMSCGKPLLISAGNNTPIVNFLKHIGCAKIVYADNVDIRSSIMAEWLSNVSSQDLRDMGRLGEDIIRKQYSREIVTKQYVDLVESLLR